LKKLRLYLSCTNNTKMFQLMNKGKEKVAPPASEQERVKSYEIDNAEIKLVKQLGSGCFGTVYLGECRETQVAVKVPHVQDLSQEDLNDLRREIQIMAMNPHPNIMLFMGACTVPGQFKIVMEVLDGDLEHLILEGEGKKMSLFQRLCMAKDAAEGMNWLHCSEPAIIHRDLKLENLMYKKVEGSFSIRVADFGLACIKPKAQKSLRDAAKGTPLTRAPEIMEDKPFNQKADVYSFAMCLWEIVTCKDLFPHHSDYDEFMEAICVKGERPPIPKSCLPSLKKLMEDCWQKDPNLRPSFAEINVRLNEILVESAISEPAGQAIWQENFIHTKLLKNPAFDKEFAPAFYRALGLAKPPRDDGKRATKDPEILSFRALRALVATPEAGTTGLERVNIEHFGKILEWFGPFKSPKGKESILDRMRIMCGLAYFHGDIDTDQASLMLKGKPEGTYLVRFSRSTPGGYAISTVSDEGIKNLKVLQNKDWEFSLTAKGKTYPSIEALITGLAGTYELKFPCPGSRFSTLGLEEVNDAYVVVKEDDEADKE